MPEAGPMGGEDEVGLDLSHLTVERLYDIALLTSRSTPRLTIKPNEKIEDLLASADRGLIGAIMREPFYLELKREFRVLLCTKDKKYASLRRRLSSTGDKSQLTIVSAISAAVASSLGLAATAIVPLCAICLIAALKMGKEAFCKAQTLDISVGPEEKCH